MICDVFLMLEVDLVLCKVPYVGLPVAEPPAFMVKDHVWRGA